MNILENKRVTAVSAVFLLAFGGLVYYGYSRSQDFAETKAELTSLGEKMEDFEAAKLPPTAANAKTLSNAVKQVEQANASLKKQLADYESFCVGDGKNITSSEFQKRVVDAIKEVAGNARAKGCNIATPAADLGMAAFKNAVPKAEDVPYRQFQLEAVKRVAGIIIDSGAASLEKVYCAPLPTEQIKARKPLPHFPLSFQVVFTAKRSMVTDGKTENTLSPLPRVLNAITTDKQYLLIPTGLSVVSEGHLTGVDAYRDASAAPQGVDLGSEGAPAKTAESRIIATRKAGDPDELVRVHLNMQVLYFPDNKAKSH